MTASKTGSGIPVSRVVDPGLKADIEICYVTRTYFTKHGAGAFDDECPKEDVADVLIDRMNEPNEWQGKIRYAPFNSLIYLRIKEDYEPFILNPNINATMFVTHANFKNSFNAAINVVNYLSKTKYAEDVIALYGNKE